MRIMAGVVYEVEWGGTLWKLGIKSPNCEMVRGNTNVSFQR
jgi:hypothetical protein